VEGPDDERFFNGVFVPFVKNKYDNIEVVKYAHLKKEKIKDFIRCIGRMKRDYIFAKDLNTSPCITARKQEVICDYTNIDGNKVIIVVKKIEGWYLAGLDQDASKRMGIRYLRDTSSMTKEKFQKIQPKHFDSIVNFKIELIRNFSIETAIKKNSSFDYFNRKWDC
jgi:hypothetical protein